ncbi:hypothetical protein [Streptomyces sp. NPDC053755]|uniref:hypothetical protein n=1 Tax=Streptomyces sp. NPDC053755 TaxID=3155815 RepID=UPI00342DF6B5
MAAGNASAAQQGDPRSTDRTAAPYAGQDGGQDGGRQWPVTVPPEVGELICEIQADLHHLPYPAHLSNGPHPIGIPHCKPVNGWQ